MVFKILHAPTLRAFFICKPPVLNPASATDIYESRCKHLSLSGWTCKDGSSSLKVVLINEVLVRAQFEETKQGI